MMRKSIYFLSISVFLSNGALAYTGERCVDACILSTVGSNNVLDREILGKVCSIESLMVSGACDPTPITSVPFTITEPGPYCLPESLQSTGAGADPMITIASDSVLLDLNSNTLDANRADVAILMDPAASKEDITIRNGRIINAAVNSILSNAALNDCVIEDVSFESITTSMQSAIRFNSLFSSGIIRECSFFGIELAGDSSVIQLASANASCILNCMFTSITGAGRNVILVSSAQRCSIDLCKFATIIFSSTASGAFDSGVISVSGGNNVSVNKCLIQIANSAAQGDNYNIINMPSVSDCLISNCSIDQFTGDSGVVAGISVGSGIVDNCVVSRGNHSANVSPSSVLGIAAGNSIVRNCAVKNINLTTETGLLCYNGSSEAVFENNLATSCNSTFVGPAAVLNGFLIASANVTALNNKAIDLMRTDTTSNSAGFNVSGADARVNGNIASSNTVAGFLISNSGNTTSFFENQSGNNTVGGGEANYRLVAGTLPVIRTFDVSAGAFGATPEPFDNISIIA